MLQEEKLKEIIALIEEKGYEPVAQLRGYIEVGNPKYITRYGGAREKIKEIDRTVILDYVNKNKKLN